LESLSDQETFSVAPAVFDEVAMIDPAVLVCLPHLPAFGSDFLSLRSWNSATTFSNANIRRDLGILAGTRRFPSRKVATLSALFVA
jgi:hypothetical protein